jgi:2,3-diketo-5-methylthio-1-phosphopentane phosphatase
VLCDFDGTIVPCETVEVLYRHFAAPPCQELVQRWTRGEIGTREELQGCFSTVRAGRSEMEAALDTIPIDPSFPGFLDLCRKRGHTFAVVSDGLTWSIDYILKRHGVEDVVIYANAIHFGRDGIRISFPWYDPQSPRRGVSKKSIVQRYQAQGCQVAFVGDGLTDLEVVGVADQVYARDRLLEHCREEGIPAIGFTDFSDLLAKWLLP